LLVEEMEKLWPKKARQEWSHFERWKNMAEIGRRPFCGIVSRKWMEWEWFGWTDWQVRLREIKNTYLLSHALVHPRLLFSYRLGSLFLCDFRNILLNFCTILII
jgi:hypothetical protein